jgi:rare lipoprotein A
LLAACGSQPTSPGGQPGTGGHYKIGNPYQINNQWYYPHEDYTYDEAGVASWYGADFHDQSTANGEIYNKNELTAAHKTLPLPSLARVTNLENGKSIVVRVNDRGPFSGARIIDVSQRCAQLLGFETQGTAKVRVQVLSDESKAIADAMRRYGRPADASSPPPVQLASAEPQNTPSLVAAPVQTETLKPIQSTAETRRELMATKPVPYAVQLPVPGNTRLFVQAGAFTVADNAQRLQKNLSRLGNTSISTAVVNGTTFYRVRVGPVGDVPQADALLKKVRLAGNSGARTVVD